MSAQEDALARHICICTANHNPAKRTECRYARNAAERALDSPIFAAVKAEAEHRLALLRSVLSFVDVNHADLPLPLLEAIRVEVELAVAQTLDAAAEVRRETAERIAQAIEAEVAGRCDPARRGWLNYAARIAREEAFRG